MVEWNARILRIFKLDVEYVDVFWLHSYVDKVLDQVLAQKATTANARIGRPSIFKDMMLILGEKIDDVNFGQKLKNFRCRKNKVVKRFIKTGL